MTDKPLTGETARAIVKHVKYGVVKVVEFDETGMALAAADVNLTTCCRHELESIALTLDAAVEVNQHRRDWEPYEATCSHPAHMLAEIGRAEVSVQQAEAEWKQAQNRAKALKEKLEEQQSALRMLVRDATEPKSMALFAGAAG